jgi:hypothetical protein
MTVSKNSGKANQPYVADARVRIGHVHLKVEDIGRIVSISVPRALDSSTAVAYRMEDMRSESLPT